MKTPSVLELLSLHSVNEEAEKKRKALEAANKEKAKLLLQAMKLSLNQMPEGPGRK